MPVALLARFGFTQKSSYLFKGESHAIRQCRPAGKMVERGVSSG
jgi:hypothetical protein